MIYEHLMEGMENARTARELETELGMTQREIRRQIEHERRDGLPICANAGKPQGYYLAASKKEMEDYCKRLEHRYQEVGLTLTGCQAAIKTLPQGGEISDTGFS